jgi:uncharacterized heparinase superfamily protein
MKLSPEELTPQQYRAMTLIAAGYSNTEVAQESNLSVKTIENWRILPHFKKLLREALSQCFDAAIAELVLNSQKVARELNKIALDSETPARVRVSAITAMLTFASKSKEAHLESRLEMLEAQLEHGIIDTQD